jgi:hypothetical protein
MSQIHEANSNFDFLFNLNQTAWLTKTKVIKFQMRLYCYITRYKKGQVVAFEALT